MAQWPGEFRFHADWPKIIRFCRVCQKETPHEIREGAGVIATFCLPCIEHALSYELDRD